MTKNELIEKIENGSEIMLTIEGRGFTIFNYNEPDIGEWDNPDTVRKYKSAEDLVERHTINGIPISRLADKINITSYS